MAKTKTELLEEAKALNLEVTTKNTVAEVSAAIASATADETATVDEESKTPTKVTKAGKHSAKALEAAEEKAAKEDRKAHASEAKAEAEHAPKQAAKPARSKLERRGKQFRSAAAHIEAAKLYSLEDSIELAKKTSTVKFDATVEMHINLNVDPRHADQNIRDNLVLPAGTGKSVRVALFADDDTAGAEISGVETITKALDKGEINFDVLIAIPANMPKLGKYARTLGPRGLMPNPKSGTVTTDVAKAVKEAKAGRVEYRVDSTGIVHLGVGKVSFTAAQLVDNARAVLNSIKANKPASVKSNYVKAIHVTTTMGPSINVSTAE